MTRPPRSILIVRLGAIGDVVHGLPLLCRLRRGFPDARIDWAVDARAAPILEGHPCLDGRVVLEKRSPLSFARAVRDLRSRRYDAAIDLQGLLGSALLASLSGARRVLGFDTARVRERLASILLDERLPRADALGPVVAQNLAFADRLGAPPVPLEFRLAPSEEERAQARALAPRGRYAAWIVGAGKDANRPFPETLSRAARALAAQGVAPLVLGGAQDAREGDAIAALAGGTSLCGRTDLRTTLALLEGAALAVGGDTGPLHMAAAMGRPVVALFGGAYPRRTGPRGGPARVLWKRWACAPCFLRRCPIGRRCLEAISGDEVAGAARELLAGA